MNDDAQKQLKMVLAAVAVVAALGLAIWSGIRAQQPAPHIVGSLGANPLGGSKAAPPLTAVQKAADPAMGGGKAASDAN